MIKKNYKGNKNDKLIAKIKLHLVNGLRLTWQLSEAYIQRQLLIKDTLLFQIPRK